MAVYDLTPVEVPAVETKYRRIRDQAAGAGVAAHLRIAGAIGATLDDAGQPPIVWDKAEDFIVSDPVGQPLD
jgi:hypothetical protein